MKVQAVATMELCFIDVGVGWPGAMHDARIFRNSALSTALRRNLENTPYHLIADSAYSLGERVIVNFRNNRELQEVQNRYIPSNEVHSYRVNSLA